MKVTADDINKRIKETRYLYDGTLTLCIVELDNGFKTVGESACVDPAEYNKELGETLARSRAFSNLWAHFGFSLSEQMHRSAKFAATATSGTPHPSHEDMRSGSYQLPDGPLTYGAEENAKPLKPEDPEADATGQLDESLRVPKDDPNSFYAHRRATDPNA